MDKQSERNKNKGKKKNTMKTGAQLQKQQSRKRTKILFWNVTRPKNNEDDFWKYLGLVETSIEVKVWEEMKEKMPRICQGQKEKRRKE